MFVLIPLMATPSQFNIGALNAESFCIRIMSAENIVMTDRNALFDDDELEMIMLLRDFMTFMW